MDDAQTTISALRDMVVAFRDARNWKQFHKPKDLASAIGIEAGELAELFLWKTDREIEERLRDRKFRTRVEEEMADILILLLSLSSIADVDLARATANKIELNAGKYPVDKAYGVAAKYTEIQDSQG